ncbi:MAG: transaldolase [Pseudomonadales bacterium]
MNKLDQLKTMTEVVADTGDIEAIKRYSPQDATTNPSLLLKAAQLPQYQSMLQSCITASGLTARGDQVELNNCVDQLLVAIAGEILAIVPGRVSLEVDARLSFDTRGTIARASHLINLLAGQGIGAERVLIKMAASWEGIQAARELEKAGINCNLTLLFGNAQALACADAGVFLISPFVGRILDWYKASTGQQYTAEQDPGVQSVNFIYDYYKQHGYKTVVMGASFRNIGEIEQLAGCDKLTISPELLGQLELEQGELIRQLNPNGPFAQSNKLIESENQFRWSLNQDAMATEKLSEGIRHFAADQFKLEQLLLQSSSRRVAS